MSVNTSVSLDDHFADFLSRAVASGRYRSASEVVRAGLRLLEDEEARMSALRAALVEGEESGEPEHFDFDAFIAALLHRARPGCGCDQDLAPEDGSNASYLNMLR